MIKQFALVVAALAIPACSSEEPTKPDTPATNQDAPKADNTAGTPPASQPSASTPSLDDVTNVAKEMGEKEAGKKVSEAVALESLSEDVVASMDEKGLAEQMLTAMEKLVSTIESVKTVDSANAASTELDKLMPVLQMLTKATEKIENPSPEVEKEYGPKFEGFGGRIMSHVMSLASKPQVMAALQPVLTKLENVMPNK